jgi:hypothetical protein
MAASACSIFTKVTRVQLLVSPGSDVFSERLIFRRPTAGEGHLACAYVFNSQDGHFNAARGMFSKQQKLQRAILARQRVSAYYCGVSSRCLND